jgi:hypothetical protein
VRQPASVLVDAASSTERHESPGCPSWNTTVRVHGPKAPTGRLLRASIVSDMVDSAFAGPRPVHGDLDVAWIHGSARRRHRTDPPLQVHAYDEHTCVLRQSKT